MHDARPCLPAPRSDVARSEPLTRSTQQGLAALWEYVKEHGVARPPRGFRTVSGFRLGEWVSRRRKLRGEDLRLDLLLESLPGWTWVPYDRAFAEKLDRFKKAIATGQPPRDQQMRCWLNVQWRAARTGKLSPERYEELRAAGVFELHVHKQRTKKLCKSTSEC
jgi:hypothetical protein